MSDHIQRLKDEHKDFNVSDLNSSFESNPIKAFQQWFDHACNSNENEPNAFCLSTVDVLSHQPSSRIVYLKDLRNNELVFYTNYSSKKGLEIDKNANASMLFFWPGLQRQIRIQGVLTKISAQESDAYFNSRPRSSQIGAWASKQSDLLESKEELEMSVKDIEKRFPEAVPRPDFWGGYALTPVFFEFWQGRPSRLHDRICFEKENDEWFSYRKNP